MPTDRRLRSNFKTIGLASSALINLIATEPATAEIKTITATGEYRMGDNDTRTDAKRLALLDAKRLALEQAGTYLESVTEVKNLGVARDELNAYTAGIVEVTELATKDVMEGATHIVRVEVTTKIDTNVVARQIDTLRKNETVKAELLRAREKAGQLQRERDDLQRQLAAAKSKTEADALAQRRRKLLTGTDVNSLIEQVWVALGRRGDSFGTSSALDLARARSLIEQVLAIDASEPRAHFLLGYLLHGEGDLGGAILEFRTAVRLEPDWAQAHTGLGLALQHKGDLDGAIKEHRTAVRLNSDDAFAHLSLGDALRDKGDVDSAIAEYRTALRIEPDDADKHYILGAALLAKGLKKEAAQEFGAFLRLAPDTSDNRESIQKARGWLRDLE